MTQATRQSHEFADFCVDVRERLMLRQGETGPIPLQAASACTDLILIQPLIL